jgi:hypothetical protein
VLLRSPHCCVYLRGYHADAIAGPRFHLASAEYRAPLVWIERGHATFPLYARRLWGALFADAGAAHAGALAWRDVRVGAGAELRLELAFRYGFEAYLSLGLARGLSKGGVTDYYLVSAVPF